MASCGGPLNSQGDAVCKLPKLKCREHAAGEDRRVPGERARRLRWVSFLRPTQRPPRQRLGGRSHHRFAQRRRGNLDDPERQGDFGNLAQGKLLDPAHVESAPLSNAALTVPLGPCRAPKEGALGPRSHDGTIIPETVDTMWGSDLTTTITGKGQAAVFIAVDHCSVECVGIHAAPRATRLEALEPIRQSLPPRKRGACASISAASPRTSPAAFPSGTIMDRNTWPTLLRELKFLGAESSPAFVRAPEGSGNSFNPRRWPHRLQLGISTTADGTLGSRTPTVVGLA